MYNCTQVQGLHDRIFDEYAGSKVESSDIVIDYAESAWELSDDSLLAGRNGEMGICLLLVADPR